METSLAEKYSATVSLGMTNSRMKDYFDFWFLGKHFEFDGQELANSLLATLKRRGKDIPTETPIGFTETFAKDASRQAVWKSFWKKSVRIDPALTLQEVVSFAASFLVPPAIAAAKGEKAKVLVFPPAIQNVGPRSFGLRHHVPCLHRRHLRWTLWSDRPLVKGDGSILSPVEISVSPVET